MTQHLTHGVLAEFEDSERMLAAARRLRAEGFRRISAFTPYRIPELGRALGVGRTRLPLVVLCAGLAGAAFAYWLQWYTVAVNYPLDVGGRPPQSAPAFILITFETTVLFASLAAFFGCVYSLGLPRLWEPVAEIEGFERATVDRFWVGVSHDDPQFDAGRLWRLLETEHPLRVVHLELKS